MRCAEASARRDLVLDLVAEVVAVDDADAAGVDHLDPALAGGGRQARRSATRSRVTPAVGSTIEMRLPHRRLSSVDLPTFGRPTMATRKGVARASPPHPYRPAPGELPIRCSREPQGAVELRQDAHVEAALARRFGDLGDELDVGRRDARDRRSGLDDDQELGGQALHVVEQRRKGLGRRRRR